MHLKTTFALFTMLAGWLVPSATAAGKLPNVVYILADDLGYGDVACQNPQSKIATPNIDRLAAQGIRVPFVARWPGKIHPGSVSHEIICETDLMATLAAVTGAKLPPGAGEDSYNILPALLGETYAPPIRETTVHHSAKAKFAIRQGNWVFIDAKTGNDSKEPDWFKEQAANHAVKILDGQKIIESGRLDRLLARRFLDFGDGLVQVHLPDIANGRDLDITLLGQGLQILQVTGAPPADADQSDGRSLVRSLGGGGDHLRNGKQGRSDGRSPFDE